MTGPDVALKLTPNSRDMICASVVLPKPGGPANSTWSSASPRDLRRLDEDPQVLLGLRLPDEFLQPLRTQMRVDGVFGFLVAVGEAGVHAACRRGDRGYFDYRDPWPPTPNPSPPGEGELAH